MLFIINSDLHNIIPSSNFKNIYLTDSILISIILFHYAGRIVKNESIQMEMSGLFIFGYKGCVLRKVIELIIRPK